MIYMQFLDLVLSIDSHFKTKIYKLVCVCLYIYECKKAKEMQGLLCMDYHDLRAIFGLRPIHSHPFQNITPRIGTYVALSMYTKERKGNA